MSEPETPPSEPGKVKIPVHQEKSALFRVVHADGVWWSVNPWNNLHLAFYSERAPIPKMVYWGRDEQGKWIELKGEREGKTGWFREMEVDISLSLPGAQAVLDAVQAYIKYMEDLPKPPAPKEESKK